MEACMTMVIQKAAVNRGKCWNAQNQHVLGLSDLSTKWSCTYLLDNIQRAYTTNSNEAELKNSHPLPWRDRVANLSSRI